MILSTYIAKALAAFTSFSFPVVLAILLEKEALSDISFFISIVMFFSVIFSAGFRDWSIKEIGDYSNKFRAYVICLSSMISLAGSLVLVLIMMLLDFDFIVAILVSLVAAIMGVEYSMSGVNQAKKLIVKSVVPREVIFRSFVILQIFLFMFFYGQPIESFIALIFLIASVVSLLAASTRKYWSFVFSFDKNVFCQVLIKIFIAKYSLFLIWVSTISIVGFAHLDIILINLFLSNSDAVAADYFLASRLALGIVFFQWIQQIALAPFLSDIRNRENKALVEEKFRTMLGFILVPAYVVFGIFCFSDPLFYWLFNEFDEDVFIAFLILSGSWLLYVSFGPSDLVLMMFNRLRVRLVVNLISLFGLVVCIYSAHFYNNLVTIALSVALTILLRGLFEFFVVIKEVGFLYTYPGVAYNTILRSFRRRRY